MKKYNNMRQLFLMFVLLIGLKGWGQTYVPFPEDSAKWSIYGEFYDLSEYTRGEHYRLRGDTIINGKNYSRVYYSGEGKDNPSYEELRCFIREDSSKKIHALYPLGTLKDTGEFVLYDFGLAVGDTFTMKLSYATSDHYLRVDSIDSVQVNTGYRKRFWMEQLSFAWAGACGYDLHWIEGIGCSLGPFYPDIGEGGCFEAYYELRCFQDNGVPIIGDDSCSIGLGIAERKQGNNLLLYPNPAKDQAALHADVPLDGQLRLYNATGQLLWERRLDRAQEVRISLVDIPPGIYLLTLSQPDGTIWMKKLAKPR